LGGYFLASPLPKVECFAGQLNQVFMNLLGNAIDAIDERVAQQQLTNTPITPGRIWIQTQVQPDATSQTEWITIQIVDNGSGMSAAVQVQVFNPFFTTKPIGKGTGLGLSISYQIVAEKHGGQMLC
jgi:signal transduction histidine kinase